jgi:hypothetical protein
MAEGDTTQPTSVCFLVLFLPSKEEKKNPLLERRINTNKMGANKNKPRKKRKRVASHGAEFDCPISRSPQHLTELKHPGPKS